MNVFSRFDAFKLHFTQIGFNLSLSRLLSDFYSLSSFTLWSLILQEKLFGK